MNLESYITERYRIILEARLRIKKIIFGIYLNNYFYQKDRKDWKFVKKDYVKIACEANDLSKKIYLISKERISNDVLQDLPYSGSC